MKNLKWQKKGLIFNPGQHTLANNCHSFAQSPQALVFDDYVRIYFSTRLKEPDNMYRSHVSYVDFDIEMQTIIAVAKNSVIPLGELGCFDEHGIFPINPVQHDGRILAYTCGWSRRKSVSVETAIGFAESFDGGVTFQKKGLGPIMAASSHEPYLVGDAFVKFFEGKFHMWYMFGVTWKKFDTEAAPDRVYKIGHAVSDDAINWNRSSGHQVVPDHLHADESMALPTVFFHDKKYHMIFCFRESFDFRKNSGRSYRLGYAYSDDLVNWKRNDSLLGIDCSLDGWDSEMLCYPHVFKVREQVYLLYNGNKFGESGFGLAALDV
ncbi:hypothetical protein DBZ36_04030 [Alginatibacterium sediminis]|uniref:Glycosylase n=1 Tax=Alginatibacterium sediminis TaxID=2164068 RepID=A0A420EI99_9ALTE|nr:hypothetical protein [Alginatibacterium sediminis]RKF20451.1 hypothetical protein DBZ36_04030 [Alginatibacterium sediminis]